MYIISLRSGDLSGHLCYLVACLLQELRREGGGVAKRALQLLGGVAGVKQLLLHCVGETLCTGHDCGARRSQLPRQVTCHGKGPALQLLQEHTCTCAYKSLGTGLGIIILLNSLFNIH